MPLPDLLERLLTTPGPSGQERPAAAVWREAAEPVGEVSSDALGSSWVRVPGTGGGPSLALVGHIDEIGVVVTHLGDDGFAAVRPIGGFDPHVMLGQRVDVLARDGSVPGVIHSRYQRRKRGDDRKPLDHEDLFLDVGAKDGDELRGLIRPGDAAVWHGAPLALRGERMASRAFDNRIGCYVALETARRVAEGGGAPGDVIAVAAVQEEVGDFAGSRTTTFATEPDLAVAIDVTRASDVRGGDHEDEGKIVLGGGPTLSRPKPRASPSPSRSRAATRGPMPTPSTSAAPACRRGSYRFRSGTCTRRSRPPISATSRARYVSSSPSRSGWSPEPASLAKLGP
jgi:putative aminopeptidase FrvX